MQPFSFVEGSSARRAIEVLVWLAAETEGGEIAICSHGDVLNEILARLSRATTVMEGAPRVSKAGRVELTIEKGAITTARSLPPPRV